MEEMAVRSHKLAAQAQAAGKFDEEIIPVTTTFQGKEITVTKDEGIRPGTSMESLATLKPCFRENGRVTAATSSQMTDGTGFVVMMQEKPLRN